MLNVCEIKTSINGEINAFHQGSPATFVRFQGCNFEVPCSFCDTERAFAKNTAENIHTPESILRDVRRISKKEEIVVLTGGEPLFQNEKDLFELLDLLNQNKYNIVIETNGTYNPAPIIQMFPDINIVMDFKLPSSGHYDSMKILNFMNLRKSDIIKFPVYSPTEFEIARCKKTTMSKNLATFVVSPIITEGKDLDLNNIKIILEQAQKEGFTISLQLHKLLGIY